MDVWLGALRLVYRVNCRCGEDHHWYILRDRSLAVVSELPLGVRLAEGFIGVGFGGNGIVVEGDGFRPTSGGKIVGDDCEGEERDVVFLCQTDGG